MFHRTPRLYITKFSQRPVVELSEVFAEKILRGKLLKIIIVIAFSKRKYCHVLISVYYFDI